MSNIRYEFPDKELSCLDFKILYFTKSEYGNDWHSTPHFHTFLELLYVYDGKGNFIIDKDSYALEKGDFVIINPYTVHTETSTAENPMKYYIFGIDNIRIDLQQNQSASDSDEAEEKVSPVFHDTEYKDKTIRYLSKVAEEFEQKKSYYFEIAYHRLCCLFVPFLRANNLKLAPNTESKNTTKEILFVKQYIDNHYAFNITIDELAQKAFINKYHLVHFFTQAYGVSPIRYLNQRRIQEAKTLLRTTDLSVRRLRTPLASLPLPFSPKNSKNSTTFPPKTTARNV